MAQPNPLITWTAWLKYTNSGTWVTRFQEMGMPENQLRRTGSSMGLPLQICAWHPMHFSVEGIPAVAARRTVLWQKAQSIPSSAAWWR